MAFDVRSYTSAQQQRLEEIRRATEKERALLALYAGKLACGSQAASSLPPDASQTLLGSSDSGRWTLLNDRAMELHALDEKLLSEEQEVERQTSELDRRLHAAERRKAELLSRLAALQHREVLVKKEEELLEEAESGAQRVSREIEAFLQGMNEEQCAMEARVSEKRARLVAAKSEARDQQKKRDALEARGRVHLEEVQDRIRGHRMDVARLSSAVNDKERWMRQEQSRLREAELATIYRLKKDIELMAISLGNTTGVAKGASP
ncbi:hypothetical protein TraAM80_07448 [Trypanosoma rangeli]|uniref:Uncharacterized protein n=1 Tax=Trypanosoma rangeli TaxID=5698 RepID=A0A422N5G1_TRYRA|nr:uncharacterized protein TraAM80_07448 [Trypanosoma rangeli]RNF00723.1 hypothetical protein TraAM80_07448 [Trypanosoma rangeli]|eukprot:RNF00723.1 hypothetical protein TraAM80_07448 [Trypanosoma rangeli]